MGFISHVHLEIKLETRKIHFGSDNFFYIIVSNLDFHCPPFKKVADVLFNKKCYLQIVVYTTFKVERPRQV